MTIPKHPCYTFDIVKAADDVGDAAKAAGKAEKAGEIGKYVDEAIEGGTGTIKSSELVFGSSTKSTQKLMNQMNSRGWTEDLIINPSTWAPDLSIVDPYIPD